MVLSRAFDLLPVRVVRRGRTLKRTVFPDRITPARKRIANRYLSGEGIEIGALHKPLPVPRSARVRYVDRLPVSELRAHYPELEQEPLVQVDILDDGELLESVAGSTVDFVVANHFLEHTQDPVRTLLNAFRVLRPGGILYLAVPDKRYTFDSDRPVTPSAHVLRDFEHGPQLSRRDHFEEWARLVEKVPEEDVARRADELMEQDYSIHYHVWTQREALELLTAVRERLDLDFDIELMERIENEVVFVLRNGARESGLVVTDATSRPAAAGAQVSSEGLGRDD
jgi:predicted SAM-dependent methyltransferase